MKKLRALMLGTARTRPHKDPQLSPSVEKVAAGASCIRALCTEAQMVLEHCQRAGTSRTSSMLLVWPNALRIARPTLTLSLFPHTHDRVRGASVGKPNFLVRCCPSSAATSNQALAGGHVDGNSRCPAACVEGRLPPWWRQEQHTVRASVL